MTYVSGDVFLLAQDGLVTVKLAGEFFPVFLHADLVGYKPEVTSI